MTSEQFEAVLLQARDESSIRLAEYAHEEVVDDLPKSEAVLDVLHRLPRWS